MFVCCEQDDCAQGVAEARNTATEVTLLALRGSNAEGVGSGDVYYRVTRTWCWKKQSWRRRARYGTPAVLEDLIRKAEEDLSSAAVTQHKEKLDLIGRKGILSDRVSPNNAKWKGIDCRNARVQKSLAYKVWVIL